jgi:hypothetical protein
MTEQNLVPVDPQEHGATGMVAAPITELTMGLRGLYLVTTQTSVYEFDLRGRRKSMVVRRSSSAATHSWASVSRSLRSLEDCVVGRRCYFTMNPDEFAVQLEYYWQWTSEIASIELIPDPETSVGRPSAIPS